jgi:hypothetical protein
MRYAPAGVNGLALGAALELLHGSRANVLQMVCARVGDDAIPYNGRVCNVLTLGRGPVGGHVDKDLFRVPCEEAGEVGVEGELDDGVFFLFAAVVVWTTLDSANGKLLDTGHGTGA